MQLHEFMHSNACSAKELQSIIKDFAELKESEIYSDNFKAYDGLVDFLLCWACVFVRRNKDTLYGKIRQIQVCKQTKSHKRNCELFYFLKLLATV
ncbi:hypothetical protein [Campylobacter troglodytis]|uniref:hypothetical protein n=1 Tax=Campylobacter troglodytis TaxID=654363 RepID=UPI003D03C756